MRTFIGLELDKELRLKLKSIQGVVKEYSDKGSWVNENNFHTTLKFLGETNSKQIDKIGETIERLSKKYSPINLKLNELGYFNNRKGKIGVLWIGFSGEVDKLKKLHKDIDEETEKLGFLKEKRKFTPHITIGRRIFLNQRFSEIKHIIGDVLDYELTINTISLFKSEEIMNKRIYTSIKSADFL